MVFDLFKKKPDETEVAIEVASSVIQVQLSLAGWKLSAVAKAKDNFALGYIFGFHDGVCQSLGIRSNTSQGFAVMGISFTKLSGTADLGGSILRQCMDLQTEQQFMRGMFSGGKEALAYCNHKTPPMGLASHLA